MQNAKLSDELFSDRNKVYHILWNLMLNATHFTEKGVIEVIYYGDKTEHLFKVKDTGKGIPLENQDYLFTDFMYNNSYTQPITENAGMGLYLSAKLAQLLGGKIWLEESNHQGSTFCFSLPFPER